MFSEFVIRCVTANVTIFVAHFVSQHYLNIHNLFFSMVPTKALVVRITEEQEAILQNRAKTLGFTKLSEYIRTILFKDDQNGT